MSLSSMQRMQQESEAPAFTKELSIIIVNWKSCDFLRQCIESVYANDQGLNFEVIVVDNASHDGAKQMLAEKFPEVLYVQSDKNLGFALANNLGFEHSAGRNLLFLNPDTQVMGNALARLDSVLNSTPDAGIVGARLLNADSSLQTSCVQAFPSVWNQLLDAETLRQRFPGASIWGTQAFSELLPGFSPVEAISGACLMIKRDLFKTVGGFSSDYFMYSEDIDLCFKAMKAGLKNYYINDAVVMHYGGQSSGAKPESNFAVIMTRESVRRFFEIRRGRSQAILYQVTMGFAAICRIFLIGGVLLITGGRYRREALGNALKKWVSVLRWSIGLETWVKKPT